MSTKNSSDTIGNRTRDLPTCSTVPQPTALSKNMVLEQNNGGGGYVSGQTEAGSRVRVTEIRKTEEEQHISVSCFYNHLIHCLLQ